MCSQSSRHWDIRVSKQAQSLPSECWGSRVRQTKNSKIYVPKLGDNSDPSVGEWINKGGPSRQ